MTPWWITFEDGVGACVEALSWESALDIASELDDRKIASCNFLPYPASPRLHRATDWPSFCMRPATCQGKTSCPRERACND
jgi:hypothetical protein